MVGRPQLSAVRRPAPGHALLSVLVAAWVCSTGAAALVRWTSWLMHTDRAAVQTRAAAQLLQNALEKGSLADIGSPAQGQPAGRTLELRDGTTLHLKEARYSEPQSNDPLRGEHVMWTVSWQDPWGVARSLSLRSFWAPPRRTV